jgi:hypothetical protein
LCGRDGFSMSRGAASQVAARGWTAGVPSPPDVRVVGWWTRQAMTHPVGWRSRPRLSSRRRLSAAMRWCSQRSLAAMPR